MNQVDDIVQIVGPDRSEGSYRHSHPAQTPGCYAYIGRNADGPSTFMSIDTTPFCFTYRTVQHEMMHALGLNHENTRPDRDVQWFYMKNNSRKGTIYINYIIITLC